MGKARQSAADDPRAERDAMAAVHTLLAPIAADAGDVARNPVLIQAEARRQLAIEARDELIRQGAGWPEVHAKIAELMESA